MIEITQEQFEEKVQDMIDGKYTRADVIKELKIDRITLNNRIQELYVINPDLYFKFISKFPYKPREYTHIDYEAMVIDIMKKGYTKYQAEEQYEINSRTIARKINKLEEENPELIEIYRKVAYYRKHKYPLPEELQREVDNLEARDVFIGGVYDKKEAELLEKERQYTSTKMAGISDQKAYGKVRTKKHLSTLYRLEIEQRVIKQNEGNTTINHKNASREDQEER